MKNIYVYTHTHWDREWYQSFESYRIQLIAVFRQIIESIESGNLSKFYLDGQAIILEDIFSIANDLIPKTISLFEQEELIAGPWYVLPDEMLVCGESLIRNLRLGIKTVSNYLPASLKKLNYVGYAPDTFGHSQDLPRILRGFDIDTAFVWRGVPDLNASQTFWWESPDKSKVLAYHLDEGYFQTLLHEISSTESNESKKSQEEQIRVSAEFFVKLSQKNNNIATENLNELLYPCGADHTAPPKKFSEILHKLNEELKPKNIQLIPIFLTEFAEIIKQKAKVPQSKIPVISKELRDNSNSSKFARAYLLPGVLSTRLYLKQANIAAEYKLFRFAEPIFSILQIRQNLSYPQIDLERALKKLLENHPHDSICGTSIDSVHTEMQQRFTEFEQIIDTNLELAKINLVDYNNSSSLAYNDPKHEFTHLRVLNPSSRPYTGAISIEFFEFFTPESNKNILTKNRSSDIQVTRSTKVDQLFSGWGRVPYYQNVIKHQGYFWLDHIDEFSIKNVPFSASIQGKAQNNISNNSSPSSLSTKKTKQNSQTSIVKQYTRSLKSDLCTIEIQKDGQIKIVFHDETNKTNNSYLLKHEIYDCGDGGDTYNFDPIEGNNYIKAKLVSVNRGLAGPLVASLILLYEINIPKNIELTNTPLFKNLDKKRNNIIDTFRPSRETILHKIECEVFLKRGSKLIEFETRWHNESIGHRLEVRLASGQKISKSYSENHFSLVERAHTKQGNNYSTKLPVEAGHEATIDRYPSQRFIIANNQIFLHKGLPEYGVIDESISFTILRSISMLSRGQIRTRGGGAGPHIEVPDAACLGENKAKYAWTALAGKNKSGKDKNKLTDEIITEAYEIAEKYETSLFACLTNKDTCGHSSLIQSSNKSISILGLESDLTENCFYLRMLNPCESKQETELKLDFSFSKAQLCSLNGSVIKEVIKEVIKTNKNNTAADSNEPPSFILVEFNPFELKTLKINLLKKIEFRNSPKKQ